MRHFNRKPEIRQALEAMDRLADRHYTRSVIGAITRGEKSQADPSQLVVDSARSLRDDDGSFWFVVGYSLVGGDDKVPPT